MNADAIRSDHAHGNEPYAHSHPADGMGFGHTYAEHEQRGNLGSASYATCESKTALTYSALLELAGTLEEA